VIENPLRHAQGRLNFTKFMGPCAIFVNLRNGWAIRA
jgi:hypothetical protein